MVGWSVLVLVLVGWLVGWLDGWLSMMFFVDLMSVTVASVSP